MEQSVGFVRTNLGEQVAFDLRQSIEAGKFSNGSKLPSSRVLARRYGVSHNVMLKALQQLREQKVILLKSRRLGYEMP